MQKNMIKSICLNGLFAALYVTLVIMFGDLSFGFSGYISLRIAELLIAICIFDKRFIFGAIVGCFLANLYGGQVIDIIVGTIQSSITVLILYYLKNKQLAVLLGSLACGVIIGCELVALGFSAIGYWIILTVFLGEYIILQIGYQLAKRYYVLIK